MHRQSVAVVILLGIFGCSSGGGTGQAPAASPQNRLVSLRQDHNADGSVRVTVSSLSTAGPIVTLSGELDFDSSRLSLQGCAIAPQIDENSASGKSLSFAERSPGVVGTVVMGGLEVLPQSADLFACTFQPLPNAPTGSASIQVSGDVADTTFVDRPYVAAAAIVPRG